MCGLFLRVLSLLCIIAWFDQGFSPLGWDWFGLEYSDFLFSASASATVSRYFR